MAELVDDLESLGYVQRQPDPSDRRAKLVGLTPSGWRAIRTGRAIIEQIEHDWGARIGDHRFATIAAACKTSSTDSTTRPDASTSRQPTNETGTDPATIDHRQRRNARASWKFRGIARGPADQPISRAAVVRELYGYETTSLGPPNVELTGEPVPLMTDWMPPEPLRKTVSRSLSLTPGVSGAWKAMLASIGTP